ncbi:serine hydrolase [Metabacillus idriensis]|uniref:serine hydrolase domain-containing protein n=1 Tax=Metabacillus idriensis TaxID=324768 RepID=UPI002813684D|nr:serine hydrolase [Metabacillus idriensis]MDR0136583.1 serine hydrolase [Metabacillus idriensis]
MTNKNLKVSESIEIVINNEGFSGVVFMKDENEVLFEKASGFSNRAEERLNTVHTRFGIASGCKLFTAIAICQLVENGMLSFDTRLNDCLDVVFPYFDENVTIHHLLTHSSGIPDYFDEETMDNFEDLWKRTPMYLLKDLNDFLPLFKNEKMMFKPGERFHYNNAAFIVLGLIVEQQTGHSFTDYIETNLFEKCGMNDSGYFSFDRLPKNTACGYIDNEDGTWKTNVYSIPIKGGADGGAYISAPDMIKLWEALLDYRLLSEKYTELLMTPHIHVKEGVDYGYGIWINKLNNTIFKYHVMGYDPGVSFHSAVYPESGIKLAIPSNKNSGPFKVMKAIEEYFEI